MERRPLECDRLSLSPFAIPLVPCLGFLPAALAAAATGLSLRLRWRTLFLLILRSGSGPLLLRRRRLPLWLYRLRLRLRSLRLRLRRKHSLLALRPAHHLRRTRLRTWLKSWLRRRSPTRFRLWALWLLSNHFSRWLSRGRLANARSLRLRCSTTLRLLLLRLLFPVLLLQLFQLPLRVAISAGSFGSRRRFLLLAGGIILRNVLWNLSRTRRLDRPVDGSVLSFVFHVKLLVLNSLRNCFNAQTLCEVLPKRRRCWSRSNHHARIVKFLRNPRRQIDLASAPCRMYRRVA